MGQFFCDAMDFRDHFSGLAESYAEHRPRYPSELYTFLASLAPERELAWDCGTGNGQAATSLAEHFENVVATDASAEQIENAFPHPRVDYRVEPAESSSLSNSGVDLVTVGTAVHWFDFESFYAEVRRVGKPGAVIAVWTYHQPAIFDAIDAVVRNYYRETLDGYWPDRFQYLEHRYRTLPFPFDELEPPELFMKTEWGLDQMLGFILSWSGTHNFIEENGEQALEPIFDELQAAWGDPERVRTLQWPLYFRIGRLPAT